MNIPGKRTILVVDDETSIRDILDRFLKARGCQPTLAADGQEALERAAEQEFEVVLLDIKMPGIPGIEVLQRLLTDYPDTGVIMVTAVAEANRAVDAMKLGAYDYVIKPFDLDDILMRVEKARERRYFRLMERRRRTLLEERVGEQASRLEAQFAALIQSLAREHRLLYGGEVPRGLQRGAGSLSGLPKELQKNMSSLEEFKQALLQILKKSHI